MHQCVTWKVWNLYYENKENEDEETHFKTFLKSSRRVEDGTVDVRRQGLKGIDNKIFLESYSKRAWADYTKARN